MKSYARKPTQQLAKIVSTPAPYKGLNDVDALAAMDPAYALILDNFVATPQGPSLRQGYRNYCTGFSTPITSFIPYNGRAGSSNRLFAVSGGAFYDVTTGGAAGAAVQSGLSVTNTYWQTAQQTFTTAASNYVIAVNGLDAPRIYNGTWGTCTSVTTPIAPGQFKNVDNNGIAVNISSFVDVLLHQQRLWYVSNNSTIAYYNDIAQVGGALYAFDFGPLFPRGGSLFKLATWTVDSSGSPGIQALLVAISSKGDVVIFNGNNPASATTWNYIATFQLGTPVGRRCTQALQGDLMFLSLDGLYPLSKYIQSARVDSAASLTYEISNTISNLVSVYQNTPGFEMSISPAANVLVLNVPLGNQVSNVQYVFHTITKAWSRFTGWPAQCFVYFNDNLYFGGPTSVCQAFYGYTDNAAFNGAGGNNIVATALTSFTSFPADIGDGVTKTVQSIKPFIATGQAGPTLSVGINTDFDTVAFLGTVSVAPPNGAFWDAVRWDGGAVWAGSLNTFNQWFSPLSKPGNNLALGISISSNSSIVWTKTQWRIKSGIEY